VAAQPTILVLDSDLPDLGLERAAADGARLSLIPPGETTTDISAVKALLIQWAKVDADVMDRYPGLKVIARFGLGLDNVDIPEATRRGIAVVNSGDYATEEVSTHAIALMLALVRRIVALDGTMRGGAWYQPKAVKGMPRLSEMTLGVVGVGNIGARVARLGAALGMNVVGYDPKAQPEGISTVETLPTLLAMADVVSLHAPLMSSTRSMLNREAFAQMRRGALIVNTSRGALIDEAALLEALEQGQIGGAALDVFEGEPLDANSPLRSRPDVILTPHVAYYSEPSVLAARSRPIEGIIAVLAGRRPPNQVNL
jgi:D-3-phosphoglycerate dehydrogenase / 2-oxoglutarate reductase